MATATAKRPTKTAKEEARVVISKPMTRKRFTTRIIGDSPLVMHAWSSKMIESIEKKQSNATAPKKRPARDPEAEYEGAFYRDADGDPCVPSVCFKNCIVTAAQRFYEGVTKVMLYGSLYVVGESMKLHYSRVEMNTSTVRLAGPSRTADLRYRPMFHDWYFDVEIEYDAAVLDEGTVVEFIQRAGFSVGLFEWRVERGGDWGRFHIRTEADA